MHWIYCSFALSHRFAVLTLGVVDTSGLRMWLTPSLRQYDASVLWTGMDVDELHIVPAGAEDFVTAGHCTEQCLRQVRPTELATVQYV